MVIEIVTYCLVAKIYYEAARTTIVLELHYGGNIASGTSIPR